MPSKYSQYYDEWVRMYESGVSLATIASKYGADPSTVRMQVRKHCHMRSISEYTTMKDLANPYVYVFDHIDSETSAYFLGLLYADGCVRKHGVRYITEISLQVCDSAILELLGEYIGRKVRYCERTNGAYAHLSINSQHMYEQLYIKGVVPRKTYVDSNEVFNHVPERLLSHFVRGFFDGDGCIAKRHGVVNSVGLCGCKSMMTHCSALFHQILNTPSGHVYPHGSIYNAIWSGRLDIYNILNWLYCDATIFMRRKHDRYIEYLEDYVDGDWIIPRDELGRFTIVEVSNECEE